MLGEELRKARERAGKTQETLAFDAGLSRPYISQLERDRTAPSLASIARICDALGVRLGHIFEHEPEPALVRKHDRPAAVGKPSTRSHLLSLRDEPRFKAIESEVEPGAGAGDELSSLPGEVEFVYVLDGSLELRIGDEIHRLETGDALTYPLSKPHTWRNASETEPLRVLWLAVPNPY